MATKDNVRGVNVAPGDGSVNELEARGKPPWKALVSARSTGLRPCGEQGGRCLQRSPVQWDRAPRCDSPFPGPIRTSGRLRWCAYSAWRKISVPLGSRNVAELPRSTDR